MPVHLPEILAAHLRTATYRPLDDEVFAAFFEQREGEQGQALWLAHVRALTRATRRSSVRSSTRRRRPRIDWDERDAWLDPAVSERRCSTSRPAKATTTRCGSQGVVRTALACGGVSSGGECRVLRLGDDVLDTGAAEQLRTEQRGSFHELRQPRGSGHMDQSRGRTRSGEMAQRVCQRCILRRRGHGARAADPESKKVRRTDL
jgi:hypothetical protein